MQITVTDVVGTAHVYASRTTNQPGPYNYEFKNESAGVKTMIVPYLEGSSLVVIAVRGAAPGTSSYTIDVWIDVFAGLTTVGMSILAEDALPGTIVFVPQPPVLPGVTLVYSFYSGNIGNALDIDPATGVVTVGSNGLDRETVPRFTTRLLAVNPLQTCMSGFLDLTVEVTDVNDNAPFFLQVPEDTAIREDVPVGSFVVQLNVTDADSSSVLAYVLLAMRYTSVHCAV